MDPTHRPTALWRLLLSDPDPASAELIAAALPADRASIAQLRDLADLDAYLTQTPVDLLLLALPDHDRAPWEMLAALRRRPDGLRHLPVIALCDRPLEPAERAGVIDKRTRVVVRPYRISELRRLVGDLLPEASP